jgi:hypothetical protein
MSSAETDFNPGTIEIMKAELTSYDGKTVRDISVNYIYSFNIDQSMESPLYTGYLQIIDSSNILEGMPIRGEETLTLVIQGMDLRTEVILNAVISEVSEINPRPSTNVVEYKLNFISKESFKANSRKILTSFKLTPSEMALKIFEHSYTKLKPPTDFDPRITDKIPLPFQGKSFDFIKEDKGQDEPDRRLVMQPAQNLTTLVIPDLNPADAMFFTAARAYAPKTSSQTFRFFETIDGYYYCTDEFLIKRAVNLENKNPDNKIDLFYAPVVDLDGRNAEAQFNRIEDLQIISKGINSSEDIVSGAYVNKVSKIDLVGKRITQSHFSFDKSTYTDMNGKPRDLKDNPHTEQFRKDMFTKENARNFVVYKDYDDMADGGSALAADRQLDAIVHNRVAYYHHLHNTAVLAKLKGRIDLRPGMIINLEIKALDFVDSVVSINETLAGRYLVKSTNNYMKEGVLSTTLGLVKFDHSGQPNDPTESIDIPTGVMMNV